MEASRPACRAIGTIIPDVTLEELHRDELAITAHSVETGAAISDHAFKLPASVEMRCGFSNSTAQTEGYVQLIYEEFLALQSSRQPFDVSTGKRSYTNMLIRSLQVTTDPQSEYALNCSVVLQEVLLTSTSETAVSSKSSVSNKNVSVKDASTASISSVQPLETKSLSSTAGAPSFASVSAIQYNQAQ